MDSLQILLMLIVLTLGTQICRFVPIVLPKTLLNHPILQKLNKMLPLVIMLLLVLTSLAMPKSTDGNTLFFAQLLALIGVVISYHWLKNILFSVALGILNLNLLLWILG